MYKSLMSQLYSSSGVSKIDCYLKNGKVTKPVDTFINGVPAMDFGKGNIAILAGIQSILISNTDNLPDEYTMTCTNVYGHKYERTFKPQPRIDNFVKECNYTNKETSITVNTADINMEKLKKLTSPGGELHGKVVFSPAIEPIKIDIPKADEQSQPVFSSVTPTATSNKYMTEPMTYRQKRFLFVLTKKNYNRNELTVTQASDLISELQRNNY